MPTKRIRNTGISWQGRYRDASGKEHSKTFKTKREAKAWEDDQIRAVRRGEWLDPQTSTITVHELVKKKLSQSAKPNTRQARNYLLANLGDLSPIPITALRPAMVRSWLHVLETGRPWVSDRSPLAANTISMIAGQLRAILTQAVNDDVILRHPMRGVVISSASKQVERDDIPDTEEIQALIRAAYSSGRGVSPNPQLARMIIVAATTGLRGGEIGGLRVKDVDFFRRELHVSQQVSQNNAGPTAPKSRRASRTVPLTEETLAALNTQLRERPRGREETIFAAKSGEPYNSLAIGTQFKNLTKRIGVTTTFHALRHYYASKLIESGVSVSVVQRVLGHSSPATTLGVYAHLWPGAEDEVRDAVRSFCGISDQKPTKDIGKIPV